MNDDQDLSRAERRLLVSVTDLPDYWERNRPHSTGLEQTARYMEALRTRLDRLVKMEERFGDDQEHLHRNRAERNALIWAISELAPPDIRVPRRRLRPPREYTAGVLEECAEHLTQGFRADHSQPGTLVNKREDIAPITVSLSAWFYLLGRAGSSPAP